MLLTLTSDTVYYSQPYKQASIERTIESPTIDLETLPEAVQAVVESDKCYCVRGAQKYSGSKVPSQNADQFKPNSHPVKGGLVLLKYWSEKQQRYIHHVAVILYRTTNRSSCAMGCGFFYHFPFVVYCGFRC